MRMIIILVSMIFCLSASDCSGVNKKIVCKQIKKNKFKPMVLCDVAYLKDDNDHPFWQCRCRCFSFNEYKIVEDGRCEWEHFSPFKSGIYPILYCNGLLGFKDYDWSEEIRPRVKKAIDLEINMCK